MHGKLAMLGLIVPAIVAIVVGCAKSQEGPTVGDTTTTRTTANRADGAKTGDMMKGLLDGRRFTGSYVENGETVTDTIEFADGHFQSHGCDMYGFDHPGYTATQNGEEITFTAHAVSAKEGNMHWTGTVTGKTLRGKYVWTKEGQNPSEMEFTATEM